LDKEKPFFELSKIKDITNELLDVIFIKNYRFKKEYKIDTDIFQIKEDDKEYIILVVSIPGVDRNSIEILVSDYEVVINAKRELFFPSNMVNIGNVDTIDFINNNAIAVENYYGSIQRTIKLPLKVKKLEQEAIYVKGMLFIKLECDNRWILKS